MWQSDGSAGTDSSGSSATSIQGRRYASDGSTVGGEFQVNTYTTDVQSRSGVVALGADGDFVVVWESEGSSGTDSSDRSVQGQRFRTPAPPIFADGFESGDTTAWTSTVP